VAVARDSPEEGWQCRNSGGLMTGEGRRGLASNVGAA
jgi:hypothetical protein